MANDKKDKAEIKLEKTLWDAACKLIGAVMPNNYMNELGEDIKTVSETLGHSNSIITFNRHVHF